MPAVSYRGLVLGANPVTPVSNAFTRTCAIAVPVGSVVFVSMRGTSGCHITSITDTGGNTYTLAGQTTTGNTASLFYTVVTTAMTTSTVLTINTSNSNTNASATALAFDNVDPTNPIGSVTTATGSAVITSSVTSAAANRHGSMLLSLATVNYGNVPQITSGSLTEVFALNTVVWMNFGYRQNADLDAYSLTYSGGGVARNWGHVLVEVNRVPSDFLTVF